MADERLRTFMFSLQAQAARRRKRLLQQAFLTHAIARRRLVILVCCLITILLTSTEASALRSCCRLHRNLGWWDTVWGTYSEARFKKTFRISRATFHYILNKISGDLHRQKLSIFSYCSWILHFSPLFRLHPTIRYLL